MSISSRFGRTAASPGAIGGMRHVRQHIEMAGRPAELAARSRCARSAARAHDDESQEFAPDRLRFLETDATNPATKLPGHTLRQHAMRDLAGNGVIERPA